MDVLSPGQSMQTIATVFFALAVVHTFAVKYLAALARRFPAGSVGENLLHFLAEVEVVFGLWAALLIAVWTTRFGIDSAVGYLDGVNFTEAGFVFVIMCMAATRPVLDLARWGTLALARLLPLRPRLGIYVTTLTVGPLLGSLITEPAAMTVTALLLRDHFFTHEMSARFRYCTLALLFVSVSIGGTLTSFAAPPVLMVAHSWNWSDSFMLHRFGWRSVVAIGTSVCGTAWYFRQELRAASSDAKRKLGHERPPLWVAAVHLLFIALTISCSHHMRLFVPVFLFFLGWCAVTREYQDELRLRESLLVAFFLGGLVTLGGLQNWWLEPLLAHLEPVQLFWGTTALTAITDNAALTYLGSLVTDISTPAKYALVAGAVCGGGLTVIANAPNPAGHGLLRDTFGEDGISPMWLLISAVPYTLLAAAVFLI
ncbi:MAG: hypothetical protein FJ146_05320 [Deltaproteobacteria bacterium]|nr:hypothetical protein [Deltaproteobacteria bacterium]